MKNHLRAATGILFMVIMSCFISSLTAFPLWAVLLSLAGVSLVPTPAGRLLMAITYPAGCDEEELVHACDECEDPELARVRAIAFIKQSFAFSNPLLASEWIAGIESGDIIIIPSTRGTFDGGTPKLVPGYGDVAEKYASSDYSLTFFDPNYKTNRDFYNSLKRSVSYKVAYKTETLVHLTDKVASIAPKAPVVDDVTGEVVWEVGVKWSSKNEPTAYLAPVGIFSCFEVT